MSNDQKLEVKLPYFTDIYRMCWLAQPFAVLCNFVLVLIYLSIMIVVWMILGIMAVIGFVVSLPFILLSDAFGWVRGWFRYGRR